MRGQLPQGCYVDAEAFGIERERLFRRLWQFAGLAPFVSAPDGYLTTEIGGIAVVVQNCNGALKAFENVCLHRGKLIQTQPWGTRPLVCGYHGWRYADDGSVATIPFESEAFRLLPAERQRLRLREFAVHVVGSLVFVNVSESPVPIEQQFRPALLDAVADATSAFDDEILAARWRRPFNWKLAYENLRDAVHPRFVHTQTLARYASFPLVSEPADVPDPGDRARVAPDLAELSFGGAEGEIRRDRPPAFSEWVDRWGTTDAYFNWLLYPNLHVLSPDGGYSFSVEHHRPVAAGETEITAFFMTARKRRPNAWLAPTLWEMAKAAKQILDEDTTVMEDVQRAIRPDSQSITQGVYEMQNRRTDRWYADNVLAGTRYAPEGVAR